MNIKRAREILKLDEKECSDKQIQKIIDQTRILARIFIKDFRAKKGKSKD